MTDTKAPDAPVIADPTTPETEGDQNQETSKEKLHEKLKDKFHAWFHAPLIKHPRPEDGPFNMLADIKKIQEQAQSQRTIADKFVGKKMRESEASKLVTSIAGEDLELDEITLKRALDGDKPSIEAFNKAYERSQQPGVRKPKNPDPNIKEGPNKLDQFQELIQKGQKQRGNEALGKKKSKEIKQPENPDQAIENINFPDKPKRPTLSTEDQSSLIVALNTEDSQHVTTIDAIFDEKKQIEERKKALSEMEDYFDNLKASSDKETDLQYLTDYETALVNVKSKLDDLSNYDKKSKQTDALATTVPPELHDKVYRVLMHEFTENKPAPYDLRTSAKYLRTQIQQLPYNENEINARNQLIDQLDKMVPVDDRSVEFDKTTIENLDAKIKGVESYFQDNLKYIDINEYTPQSLLDELLSQAEADDDIEQDYDEFLRFVKNNPDTLPLFAKFVILEKRRVAGEKARETAEDEFNQGYEQTFKDGFAVQGYKTDEEILNLKENNLDKYNEIIYGKTYTVEKTVDGNTVEEVVYEKGIWQKFQEEARNAGDKAAKEAEDSVELSEEWHAMDIKEINPNEILASVLPEKEASEFIQSASEKAIKMIEEGQDKFQAATSAVMETLKELGPKLLKNVGMAMILVLVVLVVVGGMAMGAVGGR